MTETLREVWEHLVSHQITRDIDDYVNRFAVDGAIERPFRLKGVPVHQTTDPEVAIVEFDLVGESVRGTFRQAMVYLLRARRGRVLLLREFFDTAASDELFQVAAPLLSLLARRTARKGSAAPARRGRSSVQNGRDIRRERRCKSVK
jgi:hypothetical protein